MTVRARLGRWRATADRLRTEVHALGIAARDSRTPWYAKAVVLAVVGYALSPIDLVPDFLPVLGYLDDAIVVPAGVALAVRLIPGAVMDDARERADAAAADPESASLARWIVTAVVVLAWVVVIAWAASILVSRFL